MGILERDLPHVYDSTPSIRTTCPTLSVEGRVEGEGSHASLKLSSIHDHYYTAPSTCVSGLRIVQAGGVRRTFWTAFLLSVLSAVSSYWMEPAGKPRRCKGECEVHIISSPIQNVQASFQSAPGNYRGIYQYAWVFCRILKYHRELQRRPPPIPLPPAREVSRRQIRDPTCVTSAMHQARRPITGVGAWGGGTGWDIASCHPWHVAQQHQ
ncbi:hypothetical protein GGR56DRAFT_545146 [Xylariaceae sp. FL0804]|nr:hypothetical protein GGR56DRAFT_545146 [Xylariaceae sp. FL0804]